MTLELDPNTDIDFTQGKKLCCAVCLEPATADSPNDKPFEIHTFSKGEDDVEVVIMIGLCTEHRTMAPELQEKAIFSVLLNLICDKYGLRVSHKDCSEEN